MKVVFLADVSANARVGEVKEVKNGFARNFLLPRGLALPATKESVERAGAAARAEQRRQATIDAEAQSFLGKLGTEPFVMTARVGETGRLYGSVTSQDIAEAVSARIGHEIERRSVELPEPLRQTGSYTIHLRMTRNVGADITVDVQPEGGAQPAAASAESASPERAARDQDEQPEDEYTDE